MSIRNPPRTPRAKPQGGRPRADEPQTPAPTPIAAPEPAPARLEPYGIDPALVDPRRILAAIALDGEAPATARVQACKALIATGACAGLIPGVPLPDDEPDDEATDELTRRALALMGRKQGDLPN